MPKKNKQNASTPEIPKALLGLTPSVIGRRAYTRLQQWCPDMKPPEPKPRRSSEPPPPEPVLQKTKQQVQIDRMCDPGNPRDVTYKDVMKAALYIKDRIAVTPLRLSHHAERFSMNLYYKIETGHKTGSFHERGALYALKKLSPEQKKEGVITASMGNFGLALAYHGARLKIPVTAVMPRTTCFEIMDKCCWYGATVIQHGERFINAKSYAFELLEKSKLTYINGYDHPHVIAGAGTIGFEIMEQCPETDVIIVPVGGGALVAGVAVAAKHINPEVMIYGVQPERSCCFFKAMENNYPFETAVTSSVARSLGVEHAGFNSFYTAKSLIKKMILVDDDWINRAIHHLVETESLVTEGAGATALSPLLTSPPVLAELKGKNVVCVLTGGNIESMFLSKSIQRARNVEGSIIKMTATLPADGNTEHQLYSMIANVGVYVREVITDPAWYEENDLNKKYLVLVLETMGLEHSCQLRRVLAQLFPNACTFEEEPFTPIPICVCYPKKTF